LRAEIDKMKYEYHAHGVELNRQYVSSAVIPDGTPAPVYARDAELYYQPSTHPGASLPHAWLGTRGPSARISTLDIAGKQRFMLLTGHGGERWREAARKASETTGVGVCVTSIGPFLDYEDLYGTWRRLSEVEEEGCVLVRPDLYIGWRSTTMPPDPTVRLTQVMRGLLGFSN
jgi:2,4-dichlorophenol 6-monooxygenase